MKITLTGITGALVLTLAFIFAPGLTQAATVQPSCELLLVTLNGYVEVQSGDSATVLLQKGQPFIISWESNDAKSAQSPSGLPLPLDGVKIRFAEKSGSYTYHFSSGSEQVTCAVKTIIASGTITQKPLVANKLSQKISGTVAGVGSVYVEVQKKGVLKPLVTSSIVRASDGAWSVTLPSKLPAGNYVAVLKASGAYTFTTLASTALTVGAPATTVSSHSDTVFVVQPIPLLSGGITRAGATIPVSYIQAINVGVTAGALERISLKQNGLAAASAIVGFTVSDDIGSPIQTFGTTASPIVFSNGVATLPIFATIPAKQMRLYTIKAVLAGNQTANMGLQLKLDITGITTNASLAKTVLPIRGTTWTISL